MVTHPRVESPPDKQPESVAITLRFYDIESGAERGTWTSPAVWPLTYTTANYSESQWMAFAGRPFHSPDGRKLGFFHTGKGGSVQVWVLDPAKGTLQAEYTAPSANATQTGFLGTYQRTGAFGPGDRVAVWSGSDLVTWTNPTSPAVRLAGHDNGSEIVFAPDGRRAFALDAPFAGWTVRVWSLPDGRELLADRTPPPVGNPFGTRGSGLQSMWLEGERLHVVTPYGIRVYDGTP